MLTYKFIAEIKSLLKDEESFKNPREEIKNLVTHFVQARNVDEPLLIPYELTSETIKFITLAESMSLTSGYIEEILKKNFLRDFAELVEMKNFEEIRFTEFCTIFSNLTGGIVPRIFRSPPLNVQFAEICSSAANFKYENFKFADFISDFDLPTKDEAFQALENLMPQKTFRDEINRIYNPANIQKFIGHPVHYIIKAQNHQVAKDMVNFLVSALYKNNRLLGKRVDWFSELHEGNRFFQDLNNCTVDSTVVFEYPYEVNDSRSTFAARRRGILPLILDKIKRQNKNTLFIFVDYVSDSEELGENQLIQNAEEFLDLITIYEGSGDTNSATKYLNYLLEKAAQSPADDEEIKTFFSDSKIYSASDVYNISQNLIKSRVRSQLYPAYKNLNSVAVEVKREKNEAYNKLQNLVGLNKIKELTDKIISAFWMRDKKNNLGIEDNSPSLHMVFTGNPGSAKTTVARLLAEILSEKNILSTGKFVECGRSDLVGRYVGHTAPMVKNQFKKAKGGILFIDEAYSLIDNAKGSYGDEAINTIVQEMENHRDDVIVIFAGYPDKMKDFLERNEGLRSRIAFHLDFPDYNVDELTQILQVMAKEKSYIVDGAAVEKCRKIFEKIYTTKDFGNGRYVRNLLESAIINQAARLMKLEETQEVTKDLALNLVAEDFSPIGTNLIDDNKNRIGFYV